MPPRAAASALRSAGEHRVPELVGDGVEVLDRDGLADMGGAGVVDEVVEAAERGDRLAHHPLGLGAPRHVAGRGDDIEALGAQRGDLGRAARIVGEVVERDARAAARGEAHGREPDAGGRAGHQDGAAGKVGGDHGVVLLRFRRCRAGAA